MSNGSALRAGSSHAIPRVVHWLWLGSTAVPDIFQRYAERWRLYHPSWETRLWRDDTLPALSCQAAFDSATGFKRRYDILRLEIVRQHGGVIVDMDVEPIRPLDPLLQGVSAFVGQVGAHHIGNQVLGATPRHPFFERAVERLQSAIDVDGNSSETAGKEFLRQVLDRHPEGVTVFPARTFYYEPSFEPPRRPDDFPDVYAVHHQLESYAALPDEDTVERRLEQFLSEFTQALNTAPLAERPELDHVRARLTKAERRLRRAVSREEHRHAAQLHAVRAECEQAGVRLAESERLWRRRLAEAEQRGLLGRLQKLIARRRPLP